MKVSFKHKLKRLLIKWKLLWLFQPIYEFLVYFSLGHKAKEEKTKKDFMGFYFQFIKSGDLCFDVGACKGNRVEPFLELGAKVIAIEPQPRHADYLRKKFGKNSKFILIEKGLADKKGELTLHICEETDALSTFADDLNEVFPDYKWGKKKVVSVITLDDLIKEFGLPVFCKIDVEGFEMQVLKGLRQLIPSLSFEFLKKTPAKTKACLNYLESLGYKQFNFHFGEPQKLFFPIWVGAKDIVEKIESDQNSVSSGDIYAKL